LTRDHQNLGNNCAFIHSSEGCGCNLGGKMQITDYESGKNLRDVNIVLSRDEAEELQAYLSRMLNNKDIHHIHVSEVRGMHLERELTVSINPNQIAS